MRLPKLYVGAISVITSYSGLKALYDSFERGEADTGHPDVIVTTMSLRDRVKEIEAFMYDNMLEFDTKEDAEVIKLLWGGWYNSSYKYMMNMHHIWETAQKNDIMADLIMHLKHEVEVSYHFLAMTLHDSEARKKVKEAMVHYPNPGDTKEEWEVYV